MIPSADAFGLVFGGSVSVALTSADPPTARWLREFLAPWFAPTSERADWHVHVSSAAAAYAETRVRLPADAAARPCFALDTSVLSLPVWNAGGRLNVADTERSCFLHIGRSTVDLVGDPSTVRWRFTALLVLLEIAATGMRRHSLDLHAAAVEAGGGAVVIVGPKGAGKTTLSFHLLRSGVFRAVANDRAFAGVRGDAFVAYGVPTAVKIRPPTVAQFPELVEGLPLVERPYLHHLDELPRAAAGPKDESVELALSPPQILQRLAAAPCASAPLTALVFPRIQADIDAWAIEGMSPAEISAALRSNLYGCSNGRRQPTVFEEMDGGMSPPLPHLIDALAEAVPGYRVLLGARAYAGRELAARLADIAVHTR